jgi:uncharacterized protein (TIGR03435 family)
MMRARLLGAVGIVAIVGSIASELAAQAPAPPTFEIVSIKPHAPGDALQLHGFSTTIYRGGRLTATNVTVQSLIQTAFRTVDRNLSSSQIAGGPNWITSSGFDIVATVGSDMSMEAFNNQLPALLRSLLEDRFTLKAHMEARTLPVYALTVARSDGRLGPQIHLSTVDCQAIEQARRNAPPPTLLALQDPARPCVTRSSSNSLSSDSLTMRGVVGVLERFAVDRPVVDRTGLMGHFAMTLQWTNPMSTGPQADATSGAVPSSDGPSIFTAIQEQLGLKLESTKGPVDVVVIDHVEHPNEN